MKAKESYTKAYLCDIYGLKPGKLRRLMNVVFYEELKAVGYNKLDSILSPEVVKKFAELWGTPADHLNIIE